MTDQDDRQAIVDLTVAYCYALDDRDYDGIAELFLPDAKVDYSTSFCDGIDQLTEKVRKSIGHLDATMHYVTNHKVRIDGDRATCECYLQGQHVKAGLAGGDTYIVAGRYIDELVRTPEGWRISFRKLTRVWNHGNPDVVKR